ncbi:hypothetical protein GGR52DRAFT_585717 [Hypoxylon sp. FL1284]|nr:hypothetical protein GGR52DRAFT_585717 [Hypoxylon sp. FL1284]
MNHPLESCIDPEQLCHMPKDSMFQPSSTINSTSDQYFQPHQPSMETFDDPMACFKLENTASPNVSQDSFADSGYGAGSDMYNYFALSTDTSYQGPGQPTTNNETRRPRFVDDVRDRGHDEDAILRLLDGGDEEEGTKHRPNPRSRRWSRSSNKTTTITTSDESGLDKRERNRMAASKCRKKQKRANSELQERARVMSEQHNCLVAHKAALESEMLDLKHQLLLHGACRCEPISDYLMQTARRFVRGCDDGDAASEKKRGTDESQGRGLGEGLPASVDRGQCAV